VSSYTQVRFASWRWMIAVALSAVLSLAVALTLGSDSPSLSVGSSAATTSGPSNVTPGLAHLASVSPQTRVEVIVQMQNREAIREGIARVHAADGKVVRDLHIINGFGARMPAGEAVKLAAARSVHAVSMNAKVKPSAKGSSLYHPTVAPEQPVADINDITIGPLPSPDRLRTTNDLATSYNQSVRTDKVWKTGSDPSVGRGVAIAVVDTGIDGNHKDFRGADGQSRVIASAVVNADAKNAKDGYGHGTHIAGLIAGDTNRRTDDDALKGKYVGTGPGTNLVSVKVSDEDGNTSLIDVIDGLQFVVDHKDTYNIRVVNLALNSTVAESYKTDPLDAAAEAAWFKGIVVVAAAGNRGTAEDAVGYAPGNDPYVITVGAVDDQGTKDVNDDLLADWSSRGTTQDGHAKPDLLAPGAHIVSMLAKESKYPELCPDCVTDGDYFKAGGTSQATAVVSGAIADMLESRPELTPDQLKGAILHNLRNVPGAGGELDAAAALNATTDELVSNQGLEPNQYIDPATGEIDYSRASWSRASWSDAVDPLRASWSRASWSRASWSRASWSATVESCADLARASWSRASWSRASWSRASWSDAGLDPATATDAQIEASLSAEQIALMDAEIAEAKALCADLEICTELERASWSRASWSRASWSRASWSRASWSGAAFDTSSMSDEEIEASLTDEQKAQIDAEIAEAQAICAEFERASWSRASWSRASWSRASWSRASWSTSFTK
jgi:serine protease AprX